MRIFLQTQNIQSKILVYNSPKSLRSSFEIVTADLFTSEREVAYFSNVASFVVLRTFTCFLFLYRHCSVDGKIWP